MYISAHMLVQYVYVCIVRLSVTTSHIFKKVHNFEKMRTEDIFLLSWHRSPPPPPPDYVMVILCTDRHVAQQTWYTLGLKQFTGSMSRHIPYLSKQPAQDMQRREKEHKSETQDLMTYILLHFVTFDLHFVTLCYIC